MNFGKPVWQKGQEKRVGFVLFLSALCGLSPFAMAIIVPSLPRLAQSFQLDYDSLQYIITVYLIGIGIAQPIHGFMCDRFGRRPVLLISFLFYTLASFACAFVESWSLLICLRFIQAVGVSVGTVTSRTIVNDVSQRDQAAVLLSYLSVAMGISPILAPIIGGYLDVLYGWESGFVFCGILGMIVVLFAYFKLAETRPDTITLNKNTFGEVMGRYGLLLKSPVFMGYTLIFGFCQGTFFAFLPVTPQLFENQYYIGPETFGYYWGILSFSYMIGAYCSGRLVRILDLDKSLTIGGIGIFISILILLLNAVLGTVNLGVLMGTLSSAMIFSGISSPLALTGSISHNSTMTGSASGLSSSIGMGTGAVFSFLSGMLFDGTAFPMILLMFLSVSGILGALWLSRIKQECNREM